MSKGKKITAGDIKSNDKKNTAKKGTNNTIYIVSGVIVLAIVAAVVFNTTGGGAKPANIQTGGNLSIPKAQITSTASYFPYQAGDVTMEVVAVKASDGTIRTAFNTCQVCYDSGKGYYVQEGNELVCQNCGNKFQIDQVEVVKGGCNPVPIFKQDKTDDGQNLVIAENYLNQNKGLFGRWKKS